MYYLRVKLFVYKVCINLCVKCLSTKATSALHDWRSIITPRGRICSRTVRVSLRRRSRAPWVWPALISSTRALPLPATLRAPLPPRTMARSPRGLSHWTMRSQYSPASIRSRQPPGISFRTRWWMNTRVCSQWSRKTSSSPTLSWAVTPALPHSRKYLPTSSGATVCSLL